MSLIDFREPYREEGYWWLPQTPENKIAGTLIFDQSEGVTLNLTGLLRRYGGIINNDYTTIHGIGRSGRKISLLKCFRRSSNISSPGISYEDYRGNWALLGYHAADQSDACFSSAQFAFDGIAKWVGHKPFKRISSDVERDTFSISRPPPRLIIDAGDFTLTVHSNASVDRATPNRLVAQSESVLEINSVQPQTASWFLDVATQTQSLASVCAGQHLPLNALRLRGPEIELLPDHKILPDVDVLVSMVEGAARQSRPNDPFMFALDDLLDNSPDAISRWYAAYDEVRASLNLYFAVNSTSFMFSNARFVMAAQALEVYHRSSKPGGIMDDDAYAALVGALTDAIPASTPSNMRTKLNGLLKYSNDPSLSQRIKALIKPIKQEFGPDPIGFSKKYIQKIVNTRNYNTHFSDKGEQKPFDGAELHWATRRLVALMIIVLLRHIGVADDAIHTAIGSHREFGSFLKT